MLNPVDLAKTTSGIVGKNDKRKYYRFRPARFYGGISTADCIGCCLRCNFCWSWRETTKPEACGEFYSPEDVVQRLIGIAKSKRFRQLRISGNEPTLCREHLINVLTLIPKDYQFILETNGILIGSDETYAEELSRFHNLFVRVSLKGTCEDEFSRLTGAIPEGFQLQLKALENLMRYGGKTHPACMVSFSPPKNIQVLKKRLKAIKSSFGDFEIEELILYPAIEERLRKLKIHYFTGYRPDRVPTEQI
jgi:uncharacterized Fe-S cluster-containing radical SAM superfamily protein